MVPGTEYSGSAESGNATKDSPANSWFGAGPTPTLSNPTAKVTKNATIVTPE